MPSLYVGPRNQTPDCMLAQRASYPLSPVAPFANIEQSKLTPEEPY